MTFFLRFVFLCCTLCLQGQAAALPDVSHEPQLRLAVAANFTFCMKGLVEDFIVYYNEDNVFDKISSKQIVLSFASSGKLFAQISHGAPFDVFFSADQIKPKVLVAQGAAVASTRATYAIGELVLFADTVTRTTVESRFKRGDFRRLSMANHKVAPYGVAANEVVTKYFSVAEIKKRVVSGENVTQAYQFIKTGAVDMGFISKAQLSALVLNDPVKTWSIPIEEYSQIKQDMVLLNRAEDNLLALNFIQYVFSDRGQNIIASYGYGGPR